MGEASVTAIGVIEKCAVAVNPGIDSLVEHVSDSAYVECGGEFSAASRKLCADAPDADFGSALSFRQWRIRPDRPNKQFSFS
jgi:hypothetical protein